MHLVVIGGKSAGVVQEHVQTNFDYLEVTVYENIPDFYSTVNVRAMVIDRMFIMQDGLPETVDVDMLAAFNDYLGKYYPSIRLITLLSDKETLETVSSIFISPFMVHVKADKIKPRELKELVEARPDILKQKYDYKPEKQELEDTIGEIIGEEEDQDGNDLNGLPPTPDGVLPIPAKKGILGIFKGKNKTPKAGKVKPSKKRGRRRGQGQQERGFQPLDVEDPKAQPKLEAEQEQEELNIEEQAETELPDITAFEEDIEPDSEIDFSMFDEDSNVGLGVDVPQGQKEVLEPQPEPQPDLDFSAFEEEFEEEETEPEELEYEDFEEEDDEEEAEVKPEDPSIKDLAVSGLEFKVYGESDEDEDTLDLEAEEEDNSEQEKQERLEKLAQIKDSIFDKNIDFNIEDLKTPVIEKPTINVTDVEEEIPLFEDMEGISDQYDQENVKVVETVIERVVQVGGKGAGRNQSGVRTLIVTGDRKTGVTRTALNASSYYAKQSKTLYVDFDIERKGSLLYLGLENIAEHDEHIQNGVNFLKNVNNLPNVTHTFLKGGFDCLTSMHGSEVSEDHLRSVQRILATQRGYKTIVIDCPLDNLHYLEDIILHSEVFICVESDLPATLNTVQGLSTVSESERFMTFLYNNSQFLLSKDNKEVEFRKNMAYIEDMFSLDELPLNWGKLPIIGSVVDFKTVLEKI